MRLRRRVGDGLTVMTSAETRRIEHGLTNFRTESPERPVRRTIPTRLAANPIGQHARTDVEPDAVDRYLAVLSGR